MIGTFTALNDWQIFVVSLVATVFVAGLALWLIARFLKASAREGAGITAAAYMTALGSLFAILTGFLISSEYLTLRQTQNAVGAEVAAASQLSYGSGALSPPDTELLQEKLVAYLESLSVGDWTALANDTASQSPSVGALRDLQQTVFRLADKPYVVGSAASTLQDAVNSITANRRQRVVIASGGLPAPLFGLSVIAGIALIVNSLLVASRQGLRYSLVATGIVLAVALDLGAILAISAPFQGAFRVGTEPITELVQEVRAGAYLPWTTNP